MPRFFRTGSSTKKDATPSNPPPQSSTPTKNFLRREPSTSRRRAKSADSPRLISLFRQRSRDRPKDAPKHDGTKEELFRVSVLQVQGKDQTTEQQPIHIGVLRIRSHDRHPKIETPLRIRSHDRHPKIETPPRRSTPFLRRSISSSRNTSPASSVASAELQAPRWSPKSKSSGSISSSDSTIKQSTKSPEREKRRRNMEPVGIYERGDILGLRSNNNVPKSEPFTIKTNQNNNSNSNMLRGEEKKDDGAWQEYSKPAQTGTSRFPELAGEPACTPPRKPPMKKRLRFRSDAIANKINKARSRSPELSPERTERNNTSPDRRKPKAPRAKPCADNPTLRDISETISFGLFSLCPVAFDDIEQDEVELQRTWSDESQENDSRKDLMGDFDDAQETQYGEDTISYDFASEEPDILTSY